MLDTGPLVGLLSARDVHHDMTVQALRGSLSSGRRISTTWEIIGEAYSFLRMKARVPRGAEQAREVLRWAWNSGVLVFSAVEEDHERTAELLERYEQLKISYVDGLLLAICERHAVEEVITVDAAHFGAVRLAHDLLITIV